LPRSIFGSTSLQIITQLSENLADGAFLHEKAKDLVKPKPGESYVRLESATGMLGCYVMSNGGPGPARVQFRPPSLSHVAILPEIFRGVNVEDVPVIFASLDINMSEVDR